MKRYKVKSKSRLLGLILGGLIIAGIVGLHPVSASASTVPSTTTTTQYVSSTLTRAQRISIVVNYALAQRGDDYRFGAWGPYSYDCSGLVKRSYYQVGKWLPHYTGSMLNYGYRVSKYNLQRGDVVWPQWGHVGIYLGYWSGARWMVHASSSRDAVVVSKMYGFYTARRMI